MYSKAEYKRPVDEAFARLTKAHDERTDYLCKAGVIEAREMVNGEPTAKQTLWVRILSFINKGE